MKSESTAADRKAGEGTGSGPRRRYDSSLRLERAARTRARIVVAGAALAQSLQIWDWKKVTFRAVAERAGVGVATVYRHFANERELHQAILDQLLDDAGVVFEGIALSDVGGVTAKKFASMTKFAMVKSAPDDSGPTLTIAAPVREQALRDAVRAAAPHWAEGQCEALAGVLDVLWSPASFRLLSTQWQMSPRQATDAVQWIIDLAVRAVRDGVVPPGAVPGRAEENR